MRTLLAATLGLTTALWLGAVPAMAQALQGDAPPLSKECQTPGVTVGGDFPLPAIERAIRDRKVLRIMTIGASSSYATQSYRRGYQGLLEGTLEKAIPGVDVQIVDRGVSGELARDAAERMKVELVLARADLVVWQLGTNDALARIPLDEFKDTVRSALRWLRKHNIDVVLVGQRYARGMASDPDYQAIRDALRVIAEEFRVLRIGRYEATQVIEQMRRQEAGGQPPNEFLMTDAGYACLSEYVVRAVTTSVFQGRRPPSPPQGG
jgi:lysophospholipase L1-like esterase